jgi:hypothetical protein
VRIEEIETALLQLAAALDQPFNPRNDADSTAMALGHRVRDLYRGYLNCRAANMPAPSRLLLRPMIEANILLRFIREEPEWRTRLWHAESIRVWAGLADQLHHRPMPPEQNLAGLPTREEVADMRHDIEDLRATAIAAGIQGVPPRGRLIPDVQEQAQILNTTEVWQAYVTGYMPLTFDQHVSQGSFSRAVEQTLEGGLTIHRSETQPPLFTERLLASSVFASVLVIVSTWLDLGIDDAADRLREHAIRLGPPEDLDSHKT